MDVVMPHSDMIFDPRHIGYVGYKFRFSVNGRTLTITRTCGDDEYDVGWVYGFHLRAYLPTEDIPDFASTIYTYHGLDDEKAPLDTTKVIFHPSVTTIQRRAFNCCGSLVQITIPDNITRIEYMTFSYCRSLRFIQLPRNLEFIGDQAFDMCYSLEAVFLPPTVTHIGNEAFFACTSLRFFNLAEAIPRIGNKVFQGCDRLSTTVRHNLSKVCYSTSVNPQTIQECIATHGIECATEVNNQRITALHILCANPHATADCIRTYLQLAPEAAEQEDSEGMTPFQYLCRNDITFLPVDDRNFSSLMALWYGCMPPQTETTGKKRKRG